MRGAFALAAMLAASLFAAADPPPLVMPADLSPVSGYVRFTPQTTAKAVTYVPLDDAAPVPADLLRDPRVFLLPVNGLKDGAYRFVAVASLNDEHAVVSFTIRIGKPTPMPPPVDPPKDPPPPAAAKFQFVLLKGNGPVPDGEKAAYNLPAWAELEKAGHTRSAFTLSEFPDWLKEVVGLPASVPAVIRMRVSGDGKEKRATKDGSWTALPASDAAVRELAK
jgi:hypothetical protein